MDFSIASILALDGLTNGAIYALLAMATVLLFAVTRVIFIPQGEFVAFGALTLALLQNGQVPGTAWLLVIMAAVAALMEAVQGLRRHVPVGRLVTDALKTLAYPVAITLLTMWAAPQKFPLLVQAALTLALVTPFGGLVYRLAYESLADATVLVLLIVSVGVHFALTGLGLLFFGAEGFRNPSFWDERFSLGALTLSGQTLIIFLASAALIVMLWLFFERTLSGKALRATAVNRLGARLMGISTNGAGRISFTMAAFIGALSGLLIGPTTTIFYDSGFLIGLKGFVAAVFAGLSSYPLALVGALGVGILESFGSFWASAFKEVNRVHLDPAGPAVALAAGSAFGGRMIMSARAKILAAVLVVLLAVPMLPVPEFWITQLNYIGLNAIVALGLVLLTGVAGLTSFGQAAFVGLGAYTAAYLATAMNVSPWISLFVGVGCDHGGRAHPGRDHLADVRPLPAAGHHRLGLVALLHHVQHGLAGQVRRHPGGAGDHPVRQLAAVGSQLLLPHSGCWRSWLPSA